LTDRQRHPPKRESKFEPGTTGWAPDMGCEPPVAAPAAKADALLGVSRFSDLADVPAEATLRFDPSFAVDALASDEDREDVERSVAAAVVEAAGLACASVLADAEAVAFFAASFFAGSFFGESFFAASFFAASLLPVSLVCEPEENSRVKKFPDDCSER
jgi:hypothetical protein